MKTFVTDDRAANAKADELIAKLTPYQGTLGLIAIGLGIWGVFVRSFTEHDAQHLSEVVE